MIKKSLRKIKNHSQKKANDRRIRHIMLLLSALASEESEETLNAKEAELVSKMLQLSPSFAKDNSELTSALFLYFRGLFPRGRLSIDKSAHNSSIELFTETFLKESSVIKSVFQTKRIQQLIRALIQDNLSIHRVQHASRLVDEYYDIFSEYYKALIYVSIVSATCGSLDLDRIKDLFDRAPKTFYGLKSNKGKAEYLCNLYILSKGTGIDIQGFPDMAAKASEDLKGCSVIYASALFEEFCAYGEYLELTGAWLDSLSEEDQAEHKIASVKAHYEGRIRGMSEIPVLKMEDAPDENNAMLIARHLADKEKPLEATSRETAEALAEYQKRAGSSQQLIDRLFANLDYGALKLQQPGIDYWRDFERAFLEIQPQTDEEREEVFFFANEYSLVDAAVTLPFLLEARRRGIKCYSISPRIHLDAAEPDDPVYDLVGFLSGGHDVRYFNDKAAPEAEIDIKNKRIMIKGLNAYQPIFEFITRYQFTYYYNYDTDAWARYRTTLLIRVFSELFDYIEKVEKWAVENNKKVYFISNAPHIHLAAAFRIYCEERGHNNGLYFICTSPGYDNYFANASDPRSETTTALNLTRNPYSRNSFLGTKEGFEAYYEANRYRIEEIRNKMQVHLEAQRGRIRRSTQGEKKEQIIRTIEKAKEEGRTIILLNGKVIVDLAVKYTQGCVHGDMSEWLTHAVEFSKKNSDRILLLIKPHPHENREDLTMTSEKIDDLRSLIKCELGENTIYLDNDMFTNHELIGYIDLGMVWNGTSALEFAAQGKKVLIADVWGHYDYPIGFVFPEALEEYESYMLEPASMNDKPDIGDRAIAFLEYMGSDSVRITNSYSQTTLMNFNQFETTVNFEEIAGFAANGNKQLEEYFDSIL